MGEFLNWSEQKTPDGIIENAHSSATKRHFRNASNIAVMAVNKTALINATSADKMKMSLKLF